MNDYEKIISKLEEHKIGLTKVAMRIEELSEHQKVANGRTAKVEEAVNHLREADILMGEKLKNIRDGNKRISDRTWAVITSVVSVLTVSIIIWIINK